MTRVSVQVPTGYKDWSLHYGQCGLSLHLQGTELEDSKSFSEVAIENMCLSSIVYCSLLQSTIHFPLCTLPYMSGFPFDICSVSLAHCSLFP